MEFNNEQMVYRLESIWKNDYVKEPRIMWILHVNGEANAWLVDQPYQNSFV